MQFKHSNIWEKKISNIKQYKKKFKNIAKKHIKDSESGYNYKSETLIDIFFVAQSNVCCIRFFYLL